MIFSVNIQFQSLICNIEQAYFILTVDSWVFVMNRLISLRPVQAIANSWSEQNRNLSESKRPCLSFIYSIALGESVLNKTFNLRFNQLFTLM